MPPAPAPADSDRGRDLLARARQIRQAAGVGFAEMAAEIGVAKSTLSAYERGLARCPPWRAEHWTAALEVLDRTNGARA